MPPLSERCEDEKNKGTKTIDYLLVNQRNDVSKI